MSAGAFLDAFVTAGSGGLAGVRGLVFGPDGNLYLSSEDSDEVMRYDGTTGAFLDAFVSAGSGGLDIPTGLVFGPDGNLYVSSANTGDDPTPLAAGTTARSGKLLGGRRRHRRFKSGNRSQLRPAPHQPSHRGKIRRRVCGNAGWQHQRHRRVRHTTTADQGSGITAALGSINGLLEKIPIFRSHIQIRPQKPPFRKGGWEDFRMLKYLPTHLPFLSLRNTP